MIINHNIAAMNTHRQLSTNTANTNKNIEKLSSGLRINRAGDDAAGLAISEKMRGQIRGLDQASRNAQDGISLIQTAEGALNETHSILQRMRELSVQSSNDTNTDSDRAELQKEITQLKEEIDRIGDTTEFNTKKLLDGRSGKNALVTAETGTGDLAKVISTGANAIGGTYGGITIGTAATKSAYANDGADVTAATSVGETNLVLNGVDFTFAKDTSASDVAAAINAKSKEIGFTATVAGAKVTFAANDFGSGYKLTATGTASSIIGDETLGVNAVVTGAPAGSTATIEDAKHGSVVTFVGGALDGTKIDTAGTAANDTVELTVADNSLDFQIGANAGQKINIAIQDMRSGALGVNNIDVSNATTASDSITTIDNALSKVSGERSKLGAYQNRLEHTINNLGASSENLSAAESRVRDVDMAKEMMSQTKNNILAQAAQAMLAQANQQPQGVLQLLR
ncbi:flagellin [Paenibacillus sp. P13VS]|uniref:flagellin N-terminal helical domain-containing protein n=1 Tax=Paenibacillus sp. P13VS TaxID=2697367 RepID=UPI00187B90D2|nr:flagellin [Paenibacillus sp. P13VS]MBE7681622.1 flagellin [Paenibacillus sp. P13VS]